MARGSSLAAVESFDKNVLKKSETQERGYQIFGGGYLPPLQPSFQEKSPLKNKSLAHKVL